MNALPGAATDANLCLIGRGLTSSVTREPRIAHARVDDNTMERRPPLVTLHLIQGSTLRASGMSRTTATPVAELARDEDSDASEPGLPQLVRQLSDGRLVPQLHPHAVDPPNAAAASSMLQRLAAGEVSAENAGTTIDEFLESAEDAWCGACAVCDAVESDAHDGRHVSAWLSNLDGVADGPPGEGHALLRVLINRCAAAGTGRVEGLSTAYHRRDLPSAGAPRHRAGLPRTRRSRPSPRTYAPRPRVVVGTVPLRDILRVPGGPDAPLPREGAGDAATLPR